MKRIAIASLIAAAATGAFAETYMDTARVRSVEPQYESVSVPRQVCSQQIVNEVRRDGDRHYGGAVVGGIAGAVLGNQVGNGHGREAATALGAVLGAFTGDRVANRDRGYVYQEAPREVTTCHTVNELQNQIVGYRVAYDYRGQQFSTLMRDQPGASLQVRVSVDPVGR